MSKSERVWVSRDEDGTIKFWRHKPAIWYGFGGKNFRGHDFRREEDVGERVEGEMPVKPEKYLSPFRSECEILRRLLIGLNLRKGGCMRIELVGTKENCINPIDEKKRKARSRAAPQSER